MYFCRSCGNVRHFIEHNLIETVLFLNEAGKISGQVDHFQECVEVVCGECKASSNDGNILSKETGEGCGL